MPLENVIIAAGTTPAFFAEVAALVVASAVVAYVCQRLGLMPIVGFLLAGVLIGPHALGLVQDEALIDAVAEVGVVLLLFTIGIEFSLAKLMRIKVLIFGGGGLQVGLTTAAVTGLCLAFGVGWRASVFTGFLVALSSTAIVLKLLSERRETNAPHGQVALGLLIFQDLAVVGMVLLVPMLGGAGGSMLEVAWALGKAFLIITLVLVLARRLMPKILEAVARTCSPELFLLTVIALCFGTAYLTSLAGVSLSLGAFLAGLLVSESRFSEHAFGEILPLQILFSAAFFVSVGLLLDGMFLIENLGWVLLALGGVLALKVLTTGLSALALGRSFPTAAFSGLLLAQVGEFSFVLERAGREVDLYPAGLAEAGAQTFIAATVLSMILTPFLAQAGTFLAQRLTRQAEHKRQPGLEPTGNGAASTPMTGSDKEAPIPLTNHVLIAGYGRAGRKLARALHAAEVPYLILTLSPGGAREAERDELHVLRGDYARRPILEKAGIRRARAFVVADDDPAHTERVTRVVRTLNPDLRILTRTRFEDEMPALHHAGADRVLSEERESTASLLADVLGHYQFDEAAIQIHTDALRNGQIKMSMEPVRLSEAQLHTPNCSHTDQAREVTPGADGCEECLNMGDTWVHLRVCMTCGHVGCCNSSKNKHASKHAHATSHPIARSFEPGEEWAWCYIDEAML